MIIASICLLQMLVSLLLDSRYDVGLWKIFFWTPWYPLSSSGATAAWPFTW